MKVFVKKTDAISKKKKLGRCPEPHDLTGQVEPRFGGTETKKIEEPLRRGTSMNMTITVGDLFSGYYLYLFYSIMHVVMRSCY